MNRNAWLTPDALPSGLRSCVLQFPDSEEWHALVRGCLLLLSEEQNFEAFGGITPQETADVFRQTLFTFLESDCVIVPTGAILPFAGDVEPAGFLWADGQPVSRTDYAELFFVIGVTYGPGDGSTTFTLPNLNGRVPVGVDNTQTEFNVLGETGGEKTHTLTTAQMPSHNHTQNSHNHTQNSHNHTQNPHDHTVFGLAIAAPTGVRVSLVNTSQADDKQTTSTTATNQASTAVNQAATATNVATGGGGAHNNLQPYITINYIIKF